MRGPLHTFLFFVKFRFLMFHHISIEISINLFEKGKRQIVRQVCRFLKSEIGSIPPLLHVPIAAAVSSPFCLSVCLSVCLNKHTTLLLSDHVCTVKVISSSSSTFIIWLYTHKWLEDGRGTR